MTQKDAFLQGEGDAWFKRNQGRINTESDKVIETISEILAVDTTIATIGEVGCGGAARLQALNKRFNVDVKGIDPSGAAVAKAVENGIDARVGTADHLPWGDSSVDVIIFGFCLYLCDREDLFKISAEANRVLKNRGWLIILDFYAKASYSNPYTHYAGLKSFKTNYAAMFLWHDCYTLFSHKIFGHGNGFFTDDQNEWVSVSVIRKINNP